jgi:hypothetical protein
MVFAALSFEVTGTWARAASSRPPSHSCDTPERTQVLQRTNHNRVRNEGLPASGSMLTARRPSFESSPGAWQSATHGLARGVSISTRGRRLGGGSGRVKRWIDARSSRRAHDDLPSGVALFQVGDCCGDFGEPIAPVDVGVHFARLNQVRN